MSALPTSLPNTADAAPRLGPALPAAVGTKPVQQVVKVRRDYNSWVARETMEDYALRFTPRSFRKWSALRVANTAFGAASFLILEAVGATLLVQYGFENALWAILATGLVIFLAGLPIELGGITMNRFCGSSMSAIHYAAGQIAIGAGEAFYERSI